MLFLAAALSACVAVDGDSLNCNGERIRLVGIDAPEFNCPRNRQCVEGDPQNAKDYLASHLRGKLTIERLGKDRYGRTIGAVYADGYNLSCEMILEGHAAYVARWDNGGIVARDC
ncbi:nuclease homologue [Altererythrobacter xiamenensis]|uniref:Nuclease homologue n=1 Tax=Altererythrobacter xiamenensis TaxID=1316679 RepID=A0A1Y6FHF1_9SPHN|nr:thermonuclease family protein [Altererythrobacter xiamenensis]SMQ74285.1 nuclease homologue [Altererythrobacter xiamenensis]